MRFLQSCYQRSSSNCISVGSECLNNSSGKICKDIHGLQRMNRPDSSSISTKVWMDCYKTFMLTSWCVVITLVISGLFLLCHPDVCFHGNILKSVGSVVVPCVVNTSFLLDCFVLCLVFDTVCAECVMSVLYVTSRDICELFSTTVNLWLCFTYTSFYHLRWSLHVICW